MKLWKNFAPSSIALATSILTASAVGGALLAPIAANAQAIRLGSPNGFGFGVRNDNYYNAPRRTNFRVNTRDGRLNLEIERQREPQTQINLFNDNGRPGIDIRQVQPEPDQRFQLSAPLE